MKLRTGISPCPNDVFIFSGLLLGKVKSGWEFDFLFEDIETLNGIAQNGDCDLVKVSYANALKCKGYQLLRCGGALGRGCGPLLLTGGNAWNPEAEVLVPGENTTANFLLDFWRGGASTDSTSSAPLQKKFIPFNELYRELRAKPEAQGVVIHEMRFTYARDGLRLVQDLGAHWEKITGHPIPLGALAYRQRPGIPSVEAVEQAIRDSLDWAWANEAEALELCARHSQTMEPAVIRAHIDLYVNGFTRDLGESGTKAVEFFLERLETL